MNFWNRLANNAKVGIAGGLLLILLAAVALGLWAYRTDYQVLFSDLAPRDAATMTTELDRMKVPYQLADGGNTILVAKDDVYRTRLKLMGNDMPLHGAVGFEVFNNADFGMTEFVQKVNYQRAIQGELTRTILAIEDVQSARVHLALPEQGLFKKSTTKPKASVTLAMKPGHILAADQVAGIQRLVAASVPDIVAGDVTILDQHGIALTRLASAEGAIESASTQLDSKRVTEDYLMRKVNQVLDKTLGAGAAVATVDVVLNLDQSKITTEEVLPARMNGNDNIPTGVVVRERQSTREGIASGPTAAIDPTAKNTQSGATSSVENEYQVGRRVEQIVTASGALKRMTIAVVVKRPLSDSQVQKIKDVVSLAIGFNAQRGDAVVVYSSDQLETSGGASTDTITAEQAANSDLESALAMSKNEIHNRDEDRSKVWFLLIATAILLIGVFLYWAMRIRSTKSSRLSQHDRERMLANVHLWIQGAEASIETPGNTK
jgi:flagellar M-ring protein FliF